MPKLLLAAALCCVVTLSYSQSIGIGTTTPSDKSILDISSTSKGIYLPRLTTAERDAITGLVLGDRGLLIYNTTMNKLQLFNGTSWVHVGDDLGNHQASGMLHMTNSGISNVSEIAVNGWVRNNNASFGLWNSFTNRHFYSESNAYWTLNSGNGLIFRDGLAGSIKGYVYYDGTGSFGLLAPSGNWRVRVDNSNTELYGSVYSSVNYAETIYDRNNTGFYLDMNNGSNVNVFTGNEIYVNGWFRANNQGGIYWQTYGGGWNMQDATWIRTYGNKGILASGGIAGYSTGSFGTLLGMSPQIYANYNNIGGGGIMIGDDGGFADFNDGWVQFRGTNGLQINGNSATPLRISMGNAMGTGTADNAIVPTAHGWGFVGTSIAAWWGMHASAFNVTSERSLKKDITKVTGGLREQVMNDLDKMTPYLYRYNVETDQMVAGKEAKFRPGLHMGLIVDDAPDYIQAASYDAIDVYAAATLGIAAAKHNRDEIKEIKQSLGMSGGTITVQDIGSLRTNGKSLRVNFDQTFSESLKGTTPVVTLSTNTKGADLTVQDKSVSGFTVVVNGEANNVEFDYIAMAKVRVNAIEEKVTPQVVNRMYVDEGVKSQVRNYWKESQERMKSEEQKAAREAVNVQLQRKNEIGSQVVSTEQNPK